MNRIINVIEFLVNAYQNYPEKVAIVNAKGECLTYRELFDKVSKIGNAINYLNGGIRKPVLLLSDRNIESYILILASAWAGDFYSPIDKKLPEQRIESIKNTLGNPLVLKADSATVEDLYNKGITLPETAPWEQCIDQDLLYLIFTSGSTGIPKGVGKKNSSVIDMTDGFTDAFNFPDQMITGNQAPFDFDVSVKDIYITLRNAGTLVLIPQTYFSMPGTLISYLIKNHVNTLIWAVSALRIVENYKLLDKDLPSELKLVMFSGEIMSPRTMRYWQNKLPNTTFVNLYGPTEITCNNTYYILPRQFNDDEKIPIGKSFRNCVTFLLDDNGNIINEPDKEGEICVRGICVAVGYYGDYEKTDAVFTQDPYQNKYHESIYHTGDIGHYDKDMNIIFGGRRDNQIKHMGHRIELAEIEGAIAGMQNINVNCAIFDKAHDRIVLFYESKNDEKTAIIEHLKTLMPKYMWPSVYIRMDHIPQTAHGKCDRVLLKKQAEDAE